jgi:hypothetical protein
MNDLENMLYEPLEVPIPVELEKDIKKEIQVIEYVRQNLYTIVPNLPQNLIFKIIKFNWKGGDHYPVIAILFKEDRTFNEQEKKVLDNLVLNCEPLQSYMSEVGINLILDKAKNLHVPEWEFLKSGHHFPE